MFGKLNMIKETTLNNIIEYLDEIDSTNDEAKRRVLKGNNEDFTLVASSQTAGKGRKGRSFYSPKDTGLYLTFTHFSEEGLEDNLKVTTASSVIVRRAIKNVLNIDCGIKWVNDLYYNDRKICGILCECMLKDSFGTDRNAIITGIGINLSTECFPEEISSKAGSLIDRSKSEYSDGNDFISIDVIRKKLADEIVSGLKDFFLNRDLSAYMDEYLSASLVVGKEVELSDAKGVFAKGIVKGFTNEGELILKEKDDSIKIINSGEISLVILNK
ncbi:MAG: biotin--[acetyl-CoA-carboxylase] ligase [Lachnospiraceae bacterium]|nr:biotin--[acetyl-CoA-carboxylase] ligase [Lachnospiraceae bacterium]